MSIKICSFLRTLVECKKQWVIYADVLKVVEGKRGGEMVGVLGRVEGKAPTKKVGGCKSTNLGVASVYSASSEGASGSPDGASDDSISGFSRM